MNDIIVPSHFQSLDCTLLAFITMLCAFDSRYTLLFLVLARYCLF
nr:MAG TPA: hypothetical protein [Caudoviricetes sp.]